MVDHERRLNQCRFFFQTPSMDPNNFSLRWSHFQINMIEVLDQLLRDESFVDVTLVCSDDSNSEAAFECRKPPQLIKAHKVILSACSPYFQRVLLENPCQHPIIIMPKEINQVDVQYILEFVYKGEVDVPRELIPGVLRSAELLQIKGLSEGHHLPLNSRESSVDPSDPPSRSGSQLSHSSKRKSSPKFRFKNRRKMSVPVRYDENEVEIKEEDEANKEFDEAAEEKEEEDDEDEDMPVDFTIKTEEKPAEIDPVPTFPNFSFSSWKKDRQGDFALMDDSSKKSAPSPFRNACSPPADIESEASDNEKTKDNMDISAESSFLTSFRSMTHDQYDMDKLPYSDMFSNSAASTNSTKAYTKRDMNLALEALRMRKLSLTRASELYGIPPTTLWQRANRMGIATPKKETTNKTWTEEDLNSALDALRKKEISANKAAKVYGIPSSTLYKIARKERIELAQPFNAVATSWSQDDLNKALEAIRKGMPVQKAAAEFGIPSGTLYGRCKKVGIELSKTTTVHWSEEDMTRALESVRSGGMSINQAAIHHNLPYSSLYGRINRLKREHDEWQDLDDDGPSMEFSPMMSHVMSPLAGFLGSPNGPRSILTDHRQATTTMTAGLGPPPPLALNSSITTNAVHP